MTTTSTTPQNVNFFRSTAGRTGYACTAQGTWFKTTTIRQGTSITREYKPVKVNQVPESVMVEYDEQVRIC